MIAGDFTFGCKSRGRINSLSSNLRLSELTPSGWLAQLDLSFTRLCSACFQFLTKPVQHECLCLRRCRFEIAKKINTAFTEARLSPGQMYSGVQALGHVYCKLYSGIQTAGHKHTECTVLFSSARTQLQVKIYFACFRDRVATLIFH